MRKEFICSIFAKMRKKTNKKKLILLEWYIWGTSGVMYGARDEDSSLPIDDDSLAIVGHGALD